MRTPFGKRLLLLCKSASPNDPSSQNRTIYMLNVSRIRGWLTALRPRPAHHALAHSRAAGNVVAHRAYGSLRATADRRRGQNASARTRLHSHTPQNATRNLCTDAGPAHPAVGFTLPVARPPCALGRHFTATHPSHQRVRIRMNAGKPQGLSPIFRFSSDGRGYALASAC